ncbi:MAG TPA: carbohydrate porin [Labilithrix sp.]|nr:carbohydrate porin [Labilithrix sp.]
MRRSFAALSVLAALAASIRAATAFAQATEPAPAAGAAPAAGVAPAAGAAPASDAAAGTGATSLPKPDAPVTNDSSAPAVPGRDPSRVDGTKVAQGQEPPRTVGAPSGAHEGRFEFGSYGRVQVGSDLRGGTGRGTNVVAFGPRLVDEQSYAELELRREDRWNEKVSGRIVATLGLFPPFFHFTGKSTQAIGVRNLYAQGSYDRVTMWAGSRMYRGDDIYLFNWWPLDNQNTVGGGVATPIYRSAPEEGTGRSRYETIAQIHAGQQRLDNPYQFQQVPVVAPFGFGTVDVTKLDRPRTIETLKVTQFVRPASGPSGFKAVLYGELHQLAAGSFRDTLTNTDRSLPGDAGFLAGSQLTWFRGERDTYATLFLRHARGIAAYDPLAAPITFALDRTTGSASETQIAAAGNYENDYFAVMAAGYVRFFRDGSAAAASTQKYDEGAIAVRPSVFLGDYFGVAVEGSYQQRRLQMLDPNGDGPLTASVTKLGLIPYFSPSGKGSFKRPQIRLLYTASFRNSGARALYPAEDVFAQREVEHFAGISTEWWFNFSSYP